MASTALFALSLLALASPASAALPECQGDWRQNRKGGCMATWMPAQGEAKRVYVHKGGWMVDELCFGDPRLDSGRKLLSALDKAYAKFDPATSAQSGGCLSQFNPDWGAKIVQDLWTTPMLIACPPVQGGNVCADADTQGGLWTLRLKNFPQCEQEGAGLDATVFHETLHALKADNVAGANHNAAWRRPQIEFVKDRVYAAEALCFLGTSSDFNKRQLVNRLQCREVVLYSASQPRYPELCQEFNTSFTDRPMTTLFAH